MAYMCGWNDHIHHGILIIWFWWDSVVCTVFLCMSGSYQGHLSTLEVSMLTTHVMPVPAQVEIILLLELNLIRQIGFSHVHGYGGKKFRASRDGIWKDLSRALGILNTTPWKIFFSAQHSWQAEQYSYTKKYINDWWSVCSINFLVCKHGHQCHRASMIANISWSIAE